jgi:hypothetical protein
MSAGREDDKLRRRLASLSATPTANASAPAPGKPSKKKERAAPRAATFRPGKIIFSGANEIPCIIKDITAKGARVVLEGEAALPPQVTLLMVQTAARQLAHVAWQKEREAGLTFIAS